MEDKLIREILIDIKENKLKTHSEIEEENEIILNNIYNKFKFFKKNENNKLETKKGLEGYKYITNNELYTGDYIKYINDKYFYDITLSRGGFVTNIDNNNIEILNNNIYFNLNTNNYIIFKKITEEESMKLLILENLGK